MKMNYIIPIVCAVLLGYLCASFIFNQYGIDNFVFSEKGNIYYLQSGAYTSKETSEKGIDGISNFITVTEENKYYSYIGMTTNLKNAEKIKDLYKKKGIDIYIKESTLKNDDFINQLAQYDILLENTKNEEEVNSVLKTVLATFDEVVLNK